MRLNGVVIDERALRSILRADPDVVLVGETLVRGEDPRTAVADLVADCEQALAGL